MIMQHVVMDNPAWTFTKSETLIIYVRYWVLITHHKVYCTYIAGIYEFWEPNSWFYIEVYETSLNGEVQSFYDWVQLLLVPLLCC